MSDHEVFREPEVQQAIELAREARAAEAEPDERTGGTMESAAAKVRRVQRLRRWMRRSGRL